MIYRFAAQVHISGWFDEVKRTRFVGKLGIIGKAHIVELRVLLLSKFIQYHKPDVMPGIGIFRAYIP